MGRSSGSSGNTRARPACASSSGRSRACSARPPSRWWRDGRRPSRSRRRTSRSSPASPKSRARWRDGRRHDGGITGGPRRGGGTRRAGGRKGNRRGGGGAGVRPVLGPARNGGDIGEVPEGVKRLLDIKPVETIDEVLELALLEPHP